MVDENLSNNEISQHQNQLCASNVVDTDMEYLYSNGKTKNINQSSYDFSTPSPESTSENGFSFNGSKDKNNEKKIHWNTSQVHSLLNCIEKRISDFRKKSVQKSVWLNIGKEMSVQGDFSVEHCYNKWKNLRRDIRLFNNTNNMQKLSIRNAYVMERVQKLVTEIGYENSSSRKSSSPISPNIDVVDAMESVSDMPINESWSQYAQVKSEARVKSERECHDPRNGALYDDNIISLLSDPAVLQTILLNPKILEEIIPGLDIPSLLKTILETHPESVSLSEAPDTSPINVTEKMHTKNVSTGYHNGRHQQSSSIVEVANGWPHQLHELLHSFRDEETRQIQRLDQIVNYVQVMQESTKRRLSTINQLISLAAMLISQR